MCDCNMMGDYCTDGVRRVWCVISVMNEGCGFELSWELLESCAEFLGNRSILANRVEPCGIGVRIGEQPEWDRSRIYNR